MLRISSCSPLFRFSFHPVLCFTQQVPRFAEPPAPPPLLRRLIGNPNEPTEAEVEAEKNITATSKRSQTIERARVRAKEVECATGVTRRYESQILECLLLLFSRRRVSLHSRIPARLGLGR